MACLAEMKCRQPEAACSTGDSARAEIIDAAIIAPGDTSPHTASMAPRPRIADCVISRKTFVAVENIVPVSLT